ncbi:MAG: hypothetical protein WED07_06500 [Candidatus Freyarchaeum deiterrae]
MVSDEEINEIKKKLEDHEKRIKKLEEPFEQEKEMPLKDTGVDIEDVILKFSKEAEIKEEQVRNVFVFDKNDLNLKISVCGESEAEKQFKATVCILTAYHYCYGKDEIKSRDLRKKLKWLGIGSLGNLNQTFEEYKQFIIPVGIPSSTNFSYKINLPGIKEGLKTIKELAEAK